MTRLIDLLRLAGSVMLVAVALLMATDAGLRYILRSPIVGSQDLLSTGLLLVFSLGLADSWLARSHVRMDLIYGSMPKPLQVVVEILSILLAATLATGLAYGGYVAFGRFASYGAATPLLGIPHAFLAAVVVFGAVTLGLAVLLDAFRQLTGRGGGGEPAAASE